MFQRLLLELTESTLVAAILFMIMSALLGRFEIHQSSMEPTFFEGQRVIVSQVGGRLPVQLARSVHAANATETTLLGLERGQIVVFEQTPNEPPLIKRLIGLPDETVEIRESIVYINGVPLDESYLHGVLTTCRTYCGPLTLGPDEYYFMGDNRTVSRDSRDFGPIPANQIVGHVVARFWPLDQVAAFP
ncbi:MAG: signal peptidase I [Chloroflexaceae bacterium]|nr:signal peptidase I [Chloroflexaceae bacterium]NJO05659.1 signal peptidase I [Chloroflexaceae bacterium]